MQCVLTFEMVFSISFIAKRKGKRCTSRREIQRRYPRVVWLDAMITVVWRKYEGSLGGARTSCTSLFLTHHLQNMWNILPYILYTSNKVFDRHDQGTHRASSVQTKYITSEDMLNVSFAAKWKGKRYAWEREKHKRNYLKGLWFDAMLPNGPKRI